MFSFATICFHCTTTHNNHYILLCWAALLLVVIDTGRWGSVDSFLRSRKYRWRCISQSNRGITISKEARETPIPFIPRYQLCVFQFLWLLPYGGGCVAKINADWLFRAQPPTNWFGRYRGMWQPSPAFPWVRSPLDLPYVVAGSWWFPWAVCWGGFLFDFLISWLLTNRRRRIRYLVGFPAAVCFNITNKILFGIGVFPYAMISSLVLFLPPAAPAVWFERCHHDFGFAASTTGPRVGNYVRGGGGGLRRRRAVAAAVCGFCLLHLAVPLRHLLLYAGNPSWTEEGHLHSWHMKLRSKSGDVLLRLQYAHNAVTWVEPAGDPFFNNMRRVPHRPHSLLHYVGHLGRLAHRGGRPLHAVQAYSCVSLNGNRPQPLYMEAANLLPWVDHYEAVTITGVDHFLYPMVPRRAPIPEPLAAVCRQVEAMLKNTTELAVSHSVNTTVNAMRYASSAALERLYADAGVLMDPDGAVVDTATGALAYTERGLNVDADSWRIRPRTN
jgi:hypothetical protein